MTSFVHKYYQAIFIFLIVLIAGLSFAIGFQEGQKRGNTKGDIVFSWGEDISKAQKIPLSSLEVDTEVSKDKGVVEQAEILQVAGNSEKGTYVGSKNGTKYYTPGCPATSRIKPENYIWFQSVEDATLQGYSKGSC